ncbi:unnamed protein product [Moneuplotes crassus]|uniref:Uncharacterized protein n=1 Tax=Euplotes crassus TaxID=5936 RepID=A0AAD2D701_EUPCR|nr:unnamed protein product [Moneuplotes crassus]
MDSKIRFRYGAKFKAFDPEEIYPEDFQDKLGLNDKSQITPNYQAPAMSTKPEAPNLSLVRRRRQGAFQTSQTFVSKRENENPPNNKFTDYNSDMDSEVELERRNIAMMKALRKGDTNKYQLLKNKKVKSDISESNTFQSQLGSCTGTKKNKKNSRCSSSSSTDSVDNEYWDEITNHDGSQNEIPAMFGNLNSYTDFMKLFPNFATRAMQEMRTGLSHDIKSEIKNLNKLKGTMDFDQEQDHFKRAVLDHILKIQQNKRSLKDEVDSQFLTQQLQRTRIAHEQELANLKLTAELKAKEFLQEVMLKCEKKFNEEMSSLLSQFEEVSNKLYKSEKKLEYLRNFLYHQEEELLQSRSIMAWFRREQYNNMSFISVKRINPPNDSQECDPLTMKEFSLYSSYLNLNFEDQFLIANNSIVHYYKEANHALRQRIKLLETQVVEYENNSEELHDENDKLKVINSDLERTIKDLHRRKIDAENRHRKLYEEITIDFVKEKQQLISKFEDSLRIFSEELKVRECISASLHAREDKLKEEVRKLKQIVRIPRNHFKNLEKMKFDEIINQKINISKDRQTQSTNRSLCLMTRSKSTFHSRSNYHKLHNSVATKIEAQNLPIPTLPLSPQIPTLFNPKSKLTTRLPHPLISPLTRSFSNLSPTPKSNSSNPFTQKPIPHTRVFSPPPIKIPSINPGEDFPL